MIIPTFESFCDTKKFFVETTDENGDKAKVPVRLRSACVVITTAFGEKVAFAKTNRGSNYRDSRGKKTERKNDWGDTIVNIRQLMLSEGDCKAEIYRLLDNDALASQAFQALQV